MLVDEIARDPLRFLLLSDAERRLLDSAVRAAPESALRRAFERRLERRLSAFARTSEAKLARWGPFV